MSEIQYWINQDGVQAGPVTREELEKMSLTDNAFVWRSDMTDWVRITEMSELAGCYQPVASRVVENAGIPEGEPVADAPAMPPIPVEHIVTGTPLPPAAAMPQQVPQPMQQSQQAMPKCPPTNLVWAIIATILCCLPLGVVAIIYSTKVSQKYSEGDYAAAEHYSEVSAWWCIGTIVGGIILSPFVSLIQMAMMS